MTARRISFFTASVPLFRYFSEMVTQHSNPRLPDRVTHSARTWFLGILTRMANSTLWPELTMALPFSRATETVLSNLQFIQISRLEALAADLLLAILVEMAISPWSVTRPSVRLSPGPLSWREMVMVLFSPQSLMA